MNPRVVGSEDSESLFTHLRPRRMIAEEYLARHFLSTQQALGEVNWRMRTGCQEREIPQTD